MNVPVVTPVSDTALMIRRTFAVDRQTLWDALTRPEAIMQWMGSKMAKPARVEQDLRVGGAYLIEMQGESEMHRVQGTYLDVTPPDRLVFSWAWYTTPDRESRVTYALSDADAGTTLTLSHERLFDQDARDRHGQGWTASMDSLSTYLTR